jgi:hypothetical protein
LPARDRDSALAVQSHDGEECRGRHAAFHFWFQIWQKQVELPPSSVNSQGMAANVDFSPY